MRDICVAVDDPGNRLWNPFLVSWTALASPGELPNAQELLRIGNGDPDSRWGRLCPWDLEPIAGNAASASGSMQDAEGNWVDASCAMSSRGE